MLSLGDDNAACHPSCRRGPDFTGASRATSVKSRRIRARQRRAMPRLHIRGTTRAAKPPTRPDGFGSTRLPATGISVPNAHRRRMGGRVPHSGSRSQPVVRGTSRSSASVYELLSGGSAARLPSQKSGSTPCVWPHGDRRHRGWPEGRCRSQSISPSARARLTASARLCTPSFS
jgi:hypothetical protein